MKTKAKIEKQLRKKHNSILVDTIIQAKKNDKWQEVASILTTSRRLRPEVNLDRISQEAKVGEIVVIPGKVLSQGNVDKKIKVVAMAFSEKAKEKLLSSGCQVSFIDEEIKKNPNAQGVKILRW